MPKISVLIPAYINNKKELKLLIYNLNQIKLQKMKDFEVYRKYEIGEVFKKDMKIGIWGQLYSID